MKFEIETPTGHTGIPDLSFCVVTTLESLALEKCKCCLDLWMHWEELFDQLDVPVWIISPDPLPVITEFYEKYDTCLHFARCEDEVLEQLGCKRMKSVFGKTVPVIDASISLFYRQACVLKKLRTNEKNIAEVYLKALDISYKNFVNNFRNKLTSKKEFASIIKR